MPNSIQHVLLAIIVWVVVSFISAHFSSTVLIFLILANIIDIDHLFAKPVYDFNRKSIGCHIFHKKWLIPIYFLGCFIPMPYSYFFMGVMLHLLLDYLEWVRPFSLILHKPLGSKSLDRLLKRF